MFTLGAMEYDPEVYQNPNGYARAGADSQELPTGGSEDFNNGTTQVLKHREFLKKELKFKQVVQIEDEFILEEIHIVYRLTYLKDTAIARFIDDSVLSTIN